MKALLIIALLFSAAIAAIVIPTTVETYYNLKATAARFDSINLSR